MGTTITEICNNALSKVGAQRILSIDDNTASGRACKDQYESIKRSMLRSHPWKFATKRVLLNNTGVPPVFEFSNTYSLPVDCLRVLTMEGGESFPWQVEGRNLLTDSNEAYIKYTAEVDEGIFDDNFAEALACALAMRICMPLTQSSTVLEQIKDLYKTALREARSFSAQEATGDRVYADSWLRSRS